MAKKLIMSGETSIKLALEILQDESIKVIIVEGTEISRESLIKKLQLEQNNYITITKLPELNDKIILTDELHKKSGKHFGKKHRHKNKKFF